MGRRQVFTESELLDTTESLLLEYGYDGFTLKLLSAHLKGARSTIYQYYANKDEIIAACMKRKINEVLQLAERIDESSPMQALKELLSLYVRQSELHGLLSMVYKINVTLSEPAARDVSYVQQAHETLKQQLNRLFESAIRIGQIRSDLPPLAMIAVFFSLINTPNLMDLPPQQWSDLLFKTWLEGVKPQ